MIADNKLSRGRYFIMIDKKIAISHEQKKKKDKEYNQAQATQITHKNAANKEYQCGEDQRHYTE